MKALDCEIRALEYSIASKRKRLARRALPSPAAEFQIAWLQHRRDGLAQVRDAVQDLVALRRECTCDAGAPVSTRSTFPTAPFPGAGTGGCTPCSSSDEPAAASPLPGCCTPSVAAGLVVASVQPPPSREVA